MKDIHIGSIVREKIRERGMRVIDFADALHCSRSCVYSLFERRNIDFELLVSISKIINYDLLALYKEDANLDGDYIAIIETNRMKINELSSDKRIKIIKAWKTSENPDIL